MPSGPAIAGISVGAAGAAAAAGAVVAAVLSACAGEAASSASDASVSEIQKLFLVMNLTPLKKPNGHPHTRCADSRAPLNRCQRDIMQRFAARE